MEELKEKFCGLCLLNINADGNFTIIDKFTKEMLLAVLPTMNWHMDQTFDHVLCGTCSEKLFEAYNFKSACTYVENTITPYVDSKEASVDLREIYFKEHDNKQNVSLSDSLKICRLCMQIVNSDFKSIDEVVDANLIHKFIPEVNFSSTKDPVLCKSCCDSLDVHSSFVRNCLDVNQSYTESIYHRVETVNIEEVKVNVRGTAEFIKIEGIDVKSEANESETKIESEEVQIKSEITEQKYSPATTWNNNIEKYSSKSKSRLNTELFKCSECSHTTKYSRNMKRHMTIHSEQYRTPSTNTEPLKYSCKKCSYQTNHSNNFKRHKMTHEERSCKCNFCSTEIMRNGNLGLREDEPKMYECYLCRFVSEDKNKLVLHVATHRISSEIVQTPTEPSKWKSVLQCCICDYDTPCANDLKKHIAAHKDPTDKEMFKCHVCDKFKTRFLSVFERHLWKHKDPSETGWYECEYCDFRTKFEQNVRRHMALHSGSVQPEEVFACDKCSYKTSRMSNLKRHKLTHDRKLHKCQYCNVRMTLWENLMTHMLGHKKSEGVGQPAEEHGKYSISLQPPVVQNRSVEVQTLKNDTTEKNDINDNVPRKRRSRNLKSYKCDQCPHQTYRLYDLRQHKLTHIDPSKRQSYKCGQCNAEIISKQGLRKHMVIHEFPVDSKKFKCDVCAYQTNHRYLLNKHKGVHRGPAEREVFQCEQCKCKLNSRNNLKRHLLLHKDPAEIPHRIFCCDVCNYRTTRACQLVTHKLKHGNS